MFVSAVETTKLINVASRSKCRLHGKLATGVRPATPFQAGRCGTRSPPPGLLVTNTISASPQKRRMFVAPERSAQLCAPTHTPSPWSTVPLPLASSPPLGSWIVPYGGFEPPSEVED